MLNANVALAKNDRPVREASLAYWKLLSHFREHLERVLDSNELNPSWRDPRRRLQTADYLSLFLFGLLNPVVRTMRALCQASRLKRVQEEVCNHAVSLGSFSEAQHLLDPALLERVFQDLVSQLPKDSKEARWAGGQDWLARDGSLFAALPRMSWALYGAGRAGYPNRAVRLHLSFHVLEGKPVRAQVAEGNRCERAVWEEQWVKGDAYIGDRYFAENYKLLARLEQSGCVYVLRLRDQAKIQVEEELPLSEADRKARVLRQGWARLGSCQRTRSGRVRVVWIEKSGGEQMILVSNLPPSELSAELMALLYRKRWQVELFFRWVKYLLKCRDWLAESSPGAAIQLYLALIAAVILQLYTGRRPTKRMMELIQFYMLGVASLEELTAGLKRELARLAQQKA
jgi:hypothetical protein